MDLEITIFDLNIALSNYDKHLQERQVEHVNLGQCEQVFSMSITSQ